MGAFYLLLLLPTHQLKLVLSGTPVEHKQQDVKFVLVLHPTVVKQTKIEAVLVMRVHVAVKLILITAKKQGNLLVVVKPVSVSLQGIAVQIIVPVEEDLDCIMANTNMTIVTVR